MSIFNHLIRIVGGLCIASLFFIAMSCDLSGPDKPTSGVTTLAGGSEGFANAIGRDAKFDTPLGLALSEDEQTLYIADVRNNCIRSLDIASREVSTLAGECSRTGRGKINGVGTAARFTYPQDLAFHDGTLYVADNDSIRQINVETKTVSPLGLTGTPFADTSISGLAVKPDGSKLYFLDSRKGRIREIDLAASTKTLRTLVGPNTTGNIGPEDGGPAVGAPVDGQCFGVPHAVLPLVDDKCPAALFNQPKGMMITPDGVGLIIADDPMSTHILRSVNIETGLVLSLKGATLTSGASAKAGLVGVPGQNYIADGAANRIKQLILDFNTGAVTTVDFAGNGEAESRDGSLSDSSFHQPEAITANREGDRIYVADVGSHSIRMITIRR